MLGCYMLELPGETVWASMKSLLLGKLHIGFIVGWNYSLLRYVFLAKQVAKLCSNNLRNWRTSLNSGVSTYHVTE